MHKYFPHLVHNFQTSFLALCWSLGRGSQTGLKAVTTFNTSQQCPIILLMCLRPRISVFHSSNIFFIVTVSDKLCFVQFLSIWRNAPVQQISCLHASPSFRQSASQSEVFIFPIMLLLPSPFLPFSLLTWDFEMGKWWRGVRMVRGRRSARHVKDCLGRGNWSKYFVS